MLPRFLVPPGEDPDVRLPDDEARHAHRVMRLGPGSEILVFDGRGHEWRARIAEASRDGVRVQRLERVDPVREPRVRVSLIQAVLKGDHMDAVVRDATMAGVTDIRPAITAHVAAHGDAASRGKAADRWRRVALASAKQCRRAVVPAIAAAAPLEAVIAALGPATGVSRVVLAEPATGEFARPIAQLPAAVAAVIAVGPEGGWAADEVEMLVTAGFVTASLGPRTLRADAAALVAISMARAAWNDF